MFILLNYELSKVIMSNIVGGKTHSAKRLKTFSLCEGISLSSSQHQSRKVVQVFKSKAFYSESVQNLCFSLVYQKTKL